MTADDATTRVLLAIADDLSDLGRAGAVLQELLSERLRAGDLNDARIRDAQVADVVAQHIAELSKLARTYAQALQDKHPYPLGAALSQVSLDALLNRLAPKRTVHRVDPGELDLF